MKEDKKSMILAIDRFLEPFLFVVMCSILALNIGLLMSSFNNFYLLYHMMGPVSSSGIKGENSLGDQGHFPDQGQMAMGNLLQVQVPSSGWMIQRSGYFPGMHKQILIGGGIQVSGKPTGPWFWNPKFPTGNKEEDIEAINKWNKYTGQAPITSINLQGQTHVPSCLINAAIP